MAPVPAPETLAVAGGEAPIEAPARPRSYRLASSTVVVLMRAGTVPVCIVFLLFIFLLILGSLSSFDLSLVFLD
jgi:hypothetical protein